MTKLTARQQLRVLAETTARYGINGSTRHLTRSQFNAVLALTREDLYCVPARLSKGAEIEICVAAGADFGMSEEDAKAIVKYATDPLCAHCADYHDKGEECSGRPWVLEEDSRRRFSGRKVK